MPAEDGILVLNSAQNKYILGSDIWVQATVRAVEILAGSGHCLICSTTPQTWDLTAFLAEKFRIKTLMIIKSPENEKGVNEFKETLSQYALDPALVTPVFLNEKNSGNSKSSWPVRDRFAADIAGAIFPVSIRPGGKLDNILSQEKNAKKIRHDFRVDYVHETHQKPKWTELINSNLALNEFPSGNWLFHWTRASKGAWPGEKTWTFYHDLLENPDRYVRSAGDTLSRILSEKLLRGSSWKIAENTGVVALTESTPAEALKLMRWRKRFVMFIFEPYGIAIRKETAIALGAKQVNYFTKDSQPIKPGIFTHPSGEKTDWSLEKEWRVPGDIDLSVLDKKDYFAIVPTLSDIDFVYSSSKNSNYNIFALFN